MAENIREKIEIALKFYRARVYIVDCSVVVVVAIAVAVAACHCCCCSCCCRATWKCHCFAQRSERKTEIYESFSMFFFTRDQKKAKTTSRKRQRQVQKTVNWEGVAAGRGGGMGGKRWGWFNEEVWQIGPHKKCTTLAYSTGNFTPHIPLPLQLT